MSKGNFGPTFAFRLSPEDRAKLEAVSAARNLKPGAYARQIVAKHLALDARRMPERRHVMHAEEWIQLLFEMARHGNNLNQIARAFNAGIHVGDLQDEVQAVVERHAEILEMVLTFLKPRRGLGRSKTGDAEP